MYFLCNNLPITKQKIPPTIQSVYYYQQFKISVDVLHNIYYTKASQLFIILNVYINFSLCFIFPVNFFV